ncbi:acyl-CoA thioesterase [[Eubacterium] cellulosolvens]
MVFRIDLPVRWVDTDALRVVHYSNYFRYVEAAEEELYRSLGFTFQELNEKYKIAIPRVEVFCRYKAPARFGDTVTVVLQLNEKTEKTIRYEFEILRKADGEALCTGYLKIIGLDLVNWKATTLPPDLVAKVATALE